MIAELEPSAATQSGPTIRRINLGKLHPSPTNPRKHFDQAAIEELAVSVEEHGVKMPLLGRPSKMEEGMIEIIAGERRYRASAWLVEQLALRQVAAEQDEAARLAELFQQRCDVPVIVEDLDDATVLELQLIENLQRKDLTALEEAQGYQRLLDLPEKAYTPAKIAQKIGKHINTVLYKLKMLKAPKVLQAALEEGKVGERHLVLVASIPGEKARQECANQVLKPRWGDVLSVRDTIELINDNYRQSLKGAAWDLGNAYLVPDAGPCVSCPHFAKHAATQDADLAEELGNGRGLTDPLTCLNPQCFKMKVNAVWKLKQQEAKEGVVTVLKPKEAEKIVSDNGALFHGCGHVRLDDKPGYEFTGHYNDEKTPTWRELVEDRLADGSIKVANTEGGIVELLELKVAVEAAQGHKKHGKMFEKKAAAGKKDLTPAQKKAKEKESFDSKVNARMRVCLLQHLSERAAEKGMDKEAAKVVLDVALHEAGMDGNRMICDWLKLEPTPKKKGDYSQNQSNYREAILQHVEKVGLGKADIDALVMIAIIAKWVKAWGLDCQSLQPLQKHFGFDKKTITALAKAEVEKEIAAKAAKKKPVKTAENNSSDPHNVSVEKVIATTKAADQKAKANKTPAKQAKAKTAPKKAAKKSGFSAKQIKEIGAAQQARWSKQMKAKVKKAAAATAPADDDDDDDTSDS